MLLSLRQTNPELLQHLGQSVPQVLSELQRIEKLAELKVCLHFC